MKHLIAVASILILFSCSPKKIDGADQMDDNSAEISKLEQQIKDLSAEINKNNTETEDTINSEDPNYEKMTKTVDELRSDLIRMIVQLDEKVDKRLSGLEKSYDLFKEKLDGLSNDQSNYVSIGDFETLRMTIIEDFKKKKEIVYMRMDNTQNETELESLREQISELKQTQKSLETDYKEYYDKAVSQWSTKLIAIFKKENQKQTKHLKSFITTEISRLHVTDENLKNQIENLQIKQEQYETKQDKINNQMTTANAPTIEVPNFKGDIQELQNLLDKNKKILASVKKQTTNLIDSNLANEIIHKQFVPCDNGLKDSKSCYTLGTMILRLGGQFIDPTHFKRTKVDFIRYLTLSKVSITSIVNRPSKFTVPGTTKNKNRFKRCHPNKEIDELIPPHKYWPRSIVLSLIMQNIERDLLKQRELGFIEPTISPIVSIGSWWRSKCYHNSIYGIDIKTAAPDKIKTSDHIYAAAFDPYFKSDGGQSFKFYRNYIEKNIWENDLFEIKHPLKSARLNFSVGIGLGKGDHGNGQMHIGITSEVDIGKVHRQWPYKANGIKYKDLYRSK